MVNLVETILAAGRCASEEDANDAIVKMLTPPDTREEASEMFNKTIGWDPTEYYDRKELKEVLDTSRRQPIKCTDPDITNEELFQECYEYWKRDRKLYMGATVDQVMMDHCDPADEDSVEFDEDSLTESLKREVSEDWGDDDWTDEDEVIDDDWS